MAHIFFLALSLSHITLSTAMPHGAARPKSARTGPTRLRLFRKLCLQDPQNAALCRDLHYLAIKLGRKNSTIGFWNDPLIEWPEGLHKQPINTNSLESVNAEAYAVDEATIETVMATSSNLHTGFENKHLSEPLQSPGTER